MKTLLASAPDIAGIERCVNAFWCSFKYRVNAETLAIEHPERPVPSGFAVTLKNGRYRFERVEA